MRLFAFVVAALTAVGSLASNAQAQDASPNSPQARKCMAQNGFTYEQWTSYSVGPKPAAAYRKCLAAALAKYNTGKVLAAEPPRGALATGQTVRVQCGAGKSRTVTGGSSGQPRTYGDCR